ncbi:hypothetical protein B0T19DRAFT_439021 [Cercophora scortea]|uniref:Copper-fist domain-containing protein n=1 Tax=Cercophora scortea TaxID=314031 RepID=A0AAE0MHR7_9PEZI|nr:hypothetical protein B0T19DRAFT_439021 [Cercophora scortea]
MLIDGEKWACEACVRGHRVSNCQHHERPLQHINKKGRPVSQCQHCRAMRKSRASHIKCDCGEKTHKCMHLKTTVDGHKDSCCCNHGGRCTCCHKKDLPQLDTVPESDSDNDLEADVGTPSRSSKGGSRSRRRANTTNSDGMLSFDTNGHHKPTYKHTKPSQKCGPYQLTRVNSLHSTSSAGNRSMDNLLQNTGGSDSRSSKSSTNNSNSSSRSTSSSRIAQAQRSATSEATSPLMTGSSSSFAQLNGQLPPLDLSGIKYPPYVPNSADFFGNMSDHDQPMFSAGLSAASVDWSHYDGLEFSGKDAEFAPSNYSQPQSYGGFDYTGSEQVPTLTTTTSTSGEVSEVEDYLPSSLDDFDPNGGFRNASHGFSLGNSQASLLGGTDLSGLDFDDFKYMKTSTKFLTTASSLAGDEPNSLSNTAAGYGGFSPLDDDPAFWIGDYHGLPNLTDSPGEANMASFWEGQ